MVTKRRRRNTTTLTTTTTLFHGICHELIIGTCQYTEKCEIKLCSIYDAVSIMDYTVAG
jgi:hypothetical protein